MFTEQELSLMQKAGVELDFSHTEKFSDDDWIHLSDVVEDWLQLHCYRGDDYDLTSEGVLCLDILEKLARMD